MLPKFSDHRPSPKARLLLPALVATFSATCLTIVAYLAPFDLGDEGYLYYISWRVFEGAILFRDIELFTYTPGIFYIWSGWFKLFGVSVLAARLLGVLLATANVLLMFLAVRALGGPRTLATIVALSFVMFHPWLFRSHIPMLNMGALLLAIWAVKREARWPLAALGGLAVFGAAIRLDAAATAGVLCGAAILLRQSRLTLGSVFKDGAAATIGGLALLLLIIGIFAQAGILVGWLTQLKEFIGFAATRSVASYKLSFPWLSPLGLLMMSSALLAFACAAEAVAAKRDKNLRTFKLMTLVCLHGLMNMPQFLLERPDGPHFADRSFAILLLAASIWIRRLQGKPADPGYRLVLRRVVDALLAIWGLALLFWALTGWGNSVGQLRQNTEPATIGLERVRFPVQSPLPGELMLLNRCLGPGEPLASLPWYPGANFLIRRPFPSRQIHFFPHNRMRPESQRELLAALAHPKLRYLLFDPTFRVSPAPTASIISYGPAVVRMIKTNFVRVASQPNLWIKTSVNGSPEPGCPASKAS